LKDRAEDIPLLADYFLQEVCKREGENKKFNAAAMERLQRHRWPGNVRDLRNAVQRAYLMAEGHTITDEWLQFDAAPSGGGDAGTMTIRIGTPLAEVERAVILATLRRFDNHKEKTAAALGVSLKTLYNRLKDYAQQEPGEE
jgi:DNA-binding NtrC family response regulator